MGKQITKLDLQYFITIVLIRSGLVKDLIPSDVAHVGSLIPFTYAPCQDNFMGYFQHLNFHSIVDTLFHRSECGAYATMMQQQQNITSKLNLHCFKFHHDYDIC